MQLYSPTQRSKRELYPVSFIYVWATFEHQVHDLYAFRKIQVFLIFTGQKHISGISRASNEQVQ